jgi:hypothetical protein
MPQFRTSLTDDSRVISYDRNMIIIHATGDAHGLHTHTQILEMPGKWQRHTP